MSDYIPGCDILSQISVWYMYTCYLFLYLINKQRVLNSAVFRFDAVLTTSPECFKSAESPNYSVLLL